MKTKTEKTKRNLAVVRGDGSSLWGESKGKYGITEFMTVGSFIQMSKNPNHYALNVQAYGPNTQWYQYTDNRIEKEIQKPITRFLARKGWKVISLT